MPTVQISKRELLKAVKQLSPRELDEFVQEVLDLRAKTVAPCLSASESALFEHINQGLSEEESRRYRALREKQREETLTPQEQAEFFRYSDKSEKLNAQRLEALSKLARLRKQTLTQVMVDLGIGPAPYE